MKFDPEAYTITIRKEEIDDEIFFIESCFYFKSVNFVIACFS